MLNKYLENAKKPKGIFGKLVLNKMNIGHAKLAQWGFSYLNLSDNMHILDIGCGGGANIAKMLKESPNSIVDGIDYSQDSVAVSKSTNSNELGKRCTIHHGDVLNLPYPDSSLDLITAFETIYFWPSLKNAFIEIKRALKDGGIFFICCELDNPEDKTFTESDIDMTIYSADELENLLIEAGFSNVEVHRNDKGWLCLKSVCRK